MTDVPSPPGKPRAENMKKESCKITWSSPESDNGAPVTVYVIEGYDLSSGERDKVIEEKVNEEKVREEKVSFFLNAIAELILMCPDFPPPFFFGGGVFLNTTLTRPSSVTHFTFY